MALGMQSMVSLAFEQPMGVSVQYQMMGNTMQRGEWTWETWSASATSTYTTDRKATHVCFFLFTLCVVNFSFLAL